MQLPLQLQLRAIAIDLRIWLQIETINAQIWYLFLLAFRTYRWARFAVFFLDALLIWYTKKRKKVKNAELSCEI
jgi:hypothetical protein